MAATFAEFCEVHRVSAAFADQLRDSVIVLDVTEPSTPTVAFPSSDAATQWLEELEGSERKELLAAVAEGREAFVRGSRALHTITASSANAKGIGEEKAEDPEAVFVVRPLPTALAGQRFFAAARTPVTDQYVSERRANPSKSRLRLRTPFSSGDLDITDTDTQSEAADSAATMENKQAATVEDAKNSATTLPMHVYAPNAAPILIDTELFHGHLLVRTREDTPDAYFTTVRRRLEVQLQGKFRRRPTGTVYMGGEIFRPLALSRYTRVLCGVLVKFLQRFNRKVHVSFGSAEERAHIVFPIFEVMDRVILTPDGETPPQLGSALPESGSVSGTGRRSSEGADVSLEHTYTMAFWNMFTDFESWRVVNIPGVRHVDLHTFWRDQPFNLVAYAASPDRPHSPNANGRHMIASVEVIHDSLPSWPGNDSNALNAPSDDKAPADDKEMEEEAEEQAAIAIADRYEPTADDSASENP